MHLSCSEVFWSDQLCWCGIKPLMTKLHVQLTFFLIWKAQGSDFGPLTAHPDWDISCFYVISPGICQGSTSNWTTAISCHINSPLLFTAHINLSNKGSQWNQVVNYSTRPNSLLHHVGVTGCCHPSGGCGLSFNLNRVLKYLDLFKVFLSSSLHWNKICNDRCYTYPIFDFLACYELSYTDLTFSAVPGSDISSLASVTQFSQVHNPSGHAMALGLTQPLTEMSTRNISWG